MPKENEKKAKNNNSESMDIKKHGGKRTGSGRHKRVRVIVSLQLRLSPQEKHRYISTKEKEGIKSNAIFVKKAVLQYINQQ